MSLEIITKEIKSLEAETGRTSVYLYGSLVKLTTEHSKSRLNRIGPFQYNALNHVLTDGSFVPFLKQNHVDLVISSPGGRVAFAIAMMRILYRKFNKVNVIVPSRAGSSAALMSFSGSHLYVGAGALTSDFWHEGPSLSPAQLHTLIAATKNVIKSGDVVHKEDTDLFVLANTMIKSVTNHGPMPYDTFSSICKQMGIRLDLKNLSDVDGHDPEYHIPDLSQRFTAIDYSIREYMKERGLASLLLVSDFYNFATN